MRILITGGGGLIGQAIAKKHLKEGDEVFIYDTRVNRYNDYSNLVGEDVSYYSQGNIDLWVPRILDKVKPDIISNQAALVGVGQSQYDIQSYMDNNVGFTSKLLQSLLSSEFKLKKIIHAGSMGPYGDGYKNERVNEWHEKDPQSVYAVSKLAQEELIKVFSWAYNIPAISLRYFSVYGTEQNPLNPYTGVLSIIANQCLNSDKIELYEDGSQTRDLVHIDDVANAHFLASRKDTHGFSAVNIGTELSWAMIDIAKVIRDRLSPNKEIVFNGLHRAGDIMHMKADITVANEFLHWKPQHDFWKDVNDYCDYVIANKEKFTVGNTIKEENDNILKKGLVK